MPSKTFTDNALPYNSCVFDEDGNLHVISHVYEMFISKRLKNLDTVMSYDDAYIPSPLIDVEHAYMLLPIIIQTKTGRKIFSTAGQEILTERGFVKVSNLAIGMNLKALDFYFPVTKQYGYRKYSLGIHRVRSFLKSHNIPYEEMDDHTVTDDMLIYCVDYDTEHPVIFGDTVTLGLNNYREFLMEHYGVNEWASDQIVKMYTPKIKKHCMTVKVDGVGNYVVHSGAVFKSSPLDD